VTDENHTEGGGRNVLTLTDSAAEAVKHAMDAAEGLPEGGGLRISAQDVGDSTGLGMAVAPVPSEEDQVIEEEGARVFVAPEVAPFLEDKVLDAEQQGSSIQFSLSDQASD
jgi:Fe-S cluster assembly iron-binding protein IscA